MMAMLWLQQIGPRLRTLWLAKMIGMTLGMTAFFVAYFAILHHPLFPVTTVPLIAIDRMIGFRPEALPLYLSLWVYVSLVPALLKNRRELVSCGLAALMLSVVGLGIFVLWPTALPKFEIDWSRHSFLYFLKAADISRNACPSLHAAFAVFAGVWLAHLLRDMRAGRLVRALNWLWCLGILYSTVAVRQHVALDTLSGAALGAIVAVPQLRILRRTYPDL